MVLLTRGDNPLKCGTRDPKARFATLMAGLNGAKVYHALGITELAGIGVGRDVQDSSHLGRSEEFGEGAGSLRSLCFWRDSLAGKCTPVL